MRLGIMQPYFFPYLGYFSLIKHTDKWVVFDTPQFIRHGWIERNRILKPGDGWQYIKVPLEKHSRDTVIKDIRISQNQDWGIKILAQLEHYKKKAPYYSEVINLLNEVVDHKTNSIVEFDIKALSMVCEYLGLNFDHTVFSTSDIKIYNVNAPDEWALEISCVMGADMYYNPPGGENFFDSNKYRERGIELKFLKLNLREYDQKRDSFEPGLSIIDIMMFNSPDIIREMLDDITLDS